MSVKNQRTWAILIIIFGGFAGAIVIAPLLNLQFAPGTNQTSVLHEIARFLNIRVETLVGFIIGLVGCFLILPLIFRDPDADDATEVMNIGAWNSFSHPTNLPMTIAAIWFVFIAVITYIPDNKIGEFKHGMNLAYILLIPPCLLMGLSGFQMIRRNETVNRFGRVFKGFWAYASGSIYILLGWGGLVYLLAAWILG